MASTVRCVGRLAKSVFHANKPRQILRRAQLHTSYIRFSNIDAEFTKAKERLGTLKEDPGNEAKLKLYALYKQATVGKVNIARPGMIDFVGRAKWDAWNSLGDITQEEAKKKYIETINELVGTSGAGDAGTSAAGDVSEGVQSTEGDVLLKRDGNISIIQLNRPNKKNALKTEMYEAISDMLAQAAKDSSTLSVITGTGDYYCSGNDLNNFAQINPSQIAEMAVAGGQTLRKFVGSFIDFPKPLIAVINGPAVGVSVTTLGLCDIVYATDRATFQAPFGVLGQTPEGCSTYMFPLLMGQSKANEVLLFNKKLTAVEACDRGLVTEVFPDDVFQKEVWARIKQMSELPPQTMHLSKGLIRGNHRDLLHKVNIKECEQLVERWQSQECMNAIMKFFQSKTQR